MPDMWWHPALESRNPELPLAPISMYEKEYVYPSTIKTKQNKWQINLKKWQLKYVYFYFCIKINI